MSDTARNDDWTAPGVEEVASGVHRIPLPLPNDNLRAVNVYAIADGDGLLLIDSGWAIPDGRATLERGLRALDCSFPDIRRFLVTHFHRDHYTQAIELRREFATMVSLGAGERPTLEFLEDPDCPPLESQLRGLRQAGAARLADGILAGMAAREDRARADWESPDNWLEDEEVIVASDRELAVIETPGHTRGHVVFQDRAAHLLFAGDHVLPAITPSIGFEPVPSSNPLGDFLGSLARVRVMPDALLLPAHGPVAPSVHARIDELVDHHGRRLEETEAAVARGADTSFEVAKGIRWTRRERKLDELDEFNQMLAISETTAHLMLLAAQGRVTWVLDGDVYRYQVGQCPQ